MQAGIIPQWQRAVQLVGPDRLSLTDRKPVHRAGPRQFLCRVVTVGLCFSDLKLLKQFSEHARKGEVVSGVDPAVLRDFPGYAPGGAPTVPGHEPVVEVVETGPGVSCVRPGDRVFIQADWRWLQTASSNGAFGYNFEGALQEYVLLDERLVVSPDGESMLLPAPAGERSAAAFALVEPWACVEQSYRCVERRTLLPGGRVLVVEEAPADRDLLERILAPARPARIAWAGGRAAPEHAERMASLEDADAGGFDDVLYFGSRPETVPDLFARCARNGLVLLCLCGGRFGRPVSVGLGAIHYRGVRLAGTAGNDPAAALSAIPATGELRENDLSLVVGAGGPMGVMHVIRNLCRGVPGVSVAAADISDERLDALRRIAAPLAEERGAGFRTANTRETPFDGTPSHVAIMAPVPALVAGAVATAARGAVVNIFAGIPAERNGEIDLDRYVREKLYFVGTSGSQLDDMRIVLERVRRGELDTNVSVAAVSGLEGAVDGIREVERQGVSGKIMVYPGCRGLGLTRLPDLPGPVKSRLRGGIWTREAEHALWDRFAG